MAAGSSNLGPGPSVEELLLRHAGPIRRLLERRSGPIILKHATVEDLYQETIAAALASSATFSFHDDASFMSWISTIARRAISRQLRDPRQAVDLLRIRRAESSGVGVPETRLRSGRRTPSSSAAEHEGEVKLRFAISRLPEHYRQVVVLYKIEERSLAEVAAHLHRTKGATCRLLARAMALLRANLEA